MWFPGPEVSSGALFAGPWQPLDVPSVLRIEKPVAPDVMTLFPSVPMTSRRLVAKVRVPLPLGLFLFSLS